MKFRTRLSLTWLEGRSNPSGLDGTGMTPPPTDPGTPVVTAPPVIDPIADPGAPPVSSPPVVPVTPAPGDPGVPPVIDPLPPYG